MLAVEGGTMMVDGMEGLTFTLDLVGEEETVTLVNVVDIAVDAIALVTGSCCQAIHLAYIREH